MDALRRTMSASSSGLYNSSRNRMPKRSRRGAESIPARVVAPTRVNLLTAMWMEFAMGPLPVTISTAKSSMAEYRISSAVRDRRWISSRNSTSP